VGVSPQIVDSVMMRRMMMCDFEELGMNEDELRDALIEQAQWDEDGVGDLL
jgi:hypothetical protein